MLIVILFLIAIGLLFWWSQFSIETTFYEVEGPEDLRIVQISDLHNCKFGKEQERLLARINDLNADLVVFTGDNNDFYSFKSFEILLDHLDKDKILTIAGNHEVNEDFSFYKNICKRFSLRDLEKETYVYDDKINFYGLNYPDSKFKKNYFKEDKYTVLLVHSPLLYAKYKDCKYDLIICGHMHGGQWRIPFTNIGFVSPSKGLFPKYTGGKYIMENGETMIVSRGLGNMVLIPRIFNRPELVVIDIKKSS